VLCVKARPRVILIDMFIFLLLYFCLSLVVKLLIGFTLVNWIVGKGKIIELAIPFILGTIVHLLLILLLKSLHLPWAFVAFVSAIPALLSLRDLKKLRRNFNLNFTKNYLLWLLVVGAIGATIIQVNDGISSVWENNNSDLAFHLGIISSFVLGNNFPPEYTIFPGEILSYSFLINLWTAEWWWLDPSYSELPMIFWLQWFVLWAFVPSLLSPSRIAPWLILFGGGSLFNFFYSSKELIEKNMPWSVFLSTIWVPQRSAIFGLLVVLAALRLYFMHDEKEESHLLPPFQKERTILLSGALLGLSILVHAHLVATCAMFILSVQMIKVLQSWRTTADTTEIRSLLHFTVGLSTSLLFLPLFIGKEGLVGLMAGWVTGNIVNRKWEETVLAALSMWLKSVLPIMALVITLLLQQRFRKELLVLAAMFIFGNFVRLAAWPWDQLKFFLGLYIILVFLLSCSILRLSLINLIIFIMLIVPAIWESAHDIALQNGIDIYPASSIEAASQLNKFLPKRAIVVAAPSSFSVVNLSGRFLYKGYDATLWSHGIKSNLIASRSHFQSDLSVVGRCTYKGKPISACPDFLIWGSEEQNLWHRAMPPEDWQPTALSYVYKHRQP